MEAQLVQIVGEHIALQFLVPESAIQQDESIQVFIAIDKSGSMHGSPIADAKGALISLTNKLKRAGVPLTVYLFSNLLAELSSEAIGYDALIQRVQGLTAKGGTHFTPVLHAMYSRIRRENLKRVACVWLSDGRDSVGYEDVVASAQRFERHMHEMNVAVTVHTIGFSTEHDAKLLNCLTRSGTQPGTFQYVPPNGRIPVAVNNVYTLLYKPSCRARLLCEEQTYTVRLETVEKTAGMKGLVYITEEDSEDCTLEVISGELVTKFELTLERRETIGTQEHLFLLSQFVSSKVIQVLETSESFEEVQMLAELLNEVNRRLQQFYHELQQCPILYRKQCMPIFTATSELIEKYFEVLRESQGQNLSNIQIAVLNSVANKPMLLLNLEKEIQDISGDVLREISQNEAELTDRQRTAEGMTTRSDLEIFPLGVCELSKRNWFEAVLAGDCLCLTLRLERPQNLLKNALDLKLIKLNTTMLSCDTFFDSPFFETKAGQLIQGVRNYCHGVAPRPANALVAGMPQEVINGILPLYVNEEHWAIARLRLKVLTGWSVNVDVLAYTEEQVCTFPFMVLATAAKASTQFEYAQLKVVIETCMAVYREYRHLIFGRIKTIAEAYVDNPMVRLPSSIPSNSLFLAHLYSAFVSNDINKIEHIFPYLVEEEYRRKFIRGKGVDFYSVSSKLLGINAPVQRIQELYTRASQIPWTQFLDEVCRESRRDSQESAAKVLARNNSYFAEGKPLYELARLIELFSGARPKGFEDFGLVTADQQIVLILQTLRDYQESVRVISLRANRHVNVLDPEACKAYLDQLYIEGLRRECHTSHTQVLKRLGLLQGNSDTFAFASELEHAVSIISGTSSGHPNFQAYVKALMAPHCILVVEKLKIMNRGVFNDQPIFAKPGGWKPNKKVLFKIWMCHHTEAPIEAWIDAVPEQGEYLEGQYLRKEGEFVPYRHPRVNVEDRRHWVGKPDRRVAQPRRPVRRRR